MDFQLIDYLEDENLTPHHFDYRNDSPTERKKTQIIYVDFPLYLASLKRSFKNISPEAQLVKDFNRTDIFVNFHPAKKRESFVRYITERYNTHMTRLLLSSTTQAVMGIPFELVHKALGADPDVHVTDVDYETETKYGIPPRMSVHFVLDRKNRDKAQVLVLKYLRIFHLDPEDSTVTPICLLRMKFVLNIGSSDKESDATIHVKRFPLNNTSFKSDV